MSDHYDQWADKQRAMGRRVPPTSAPYVPPKDPAVDLGMLFEPHNFRGAELVCSHVYSDRTICGLSVLNHPSFEEKK